MSTRMPIADDTIDGASVETVILKSNRASSCHMCGFSDWSPGDTKYVVEHWGVEDDDERKNHEAPSREHLCPSCAVTRDLDYDRYYRQNKNAPSSVSQAAQNEIQTLSASAWQALKDKRKRTRQKPLSRVEVSPKRPKTDESLDTVYLTAAENLERAHIPACSLSLHSKSPLFVAWNGVLVMVYEGFPPSITKAKEILEESVSDLKAENFGSKWPKTTLATVNDTVPDFSLEELTRLKIICDCYSQKIIHLRGQEERETDTSSDSCSTKFDIETISIVEYQCRSLEKLSSRLSITISLAQNGYSFAEATQVEKDVVHSVVQEWNNGSLSDYLPKVNAPGSRMTSYRQKHHGVTCVTFLQSHLQELKRLQQILVDFRIAVDLEFPGRYAWHTEQSLHCTLRSLDR